MEAYVSGERRPSLALDIAKSPTRRLFAALALCNDAERGASMTKLSGGSFLETRE